MLEKKRKNIKEIEKKNITTENKGTFRKLQKPTSRETQEYFREI